MGYVRYALQLLHSLGHIGDRTKLLAILAGAAGGAVAIAGMEAFSARTAFPLVAIPFATSTVTVLGSPRAEPAQPRPLVGGRLRGIFVIEVYHVGEKTDA